MATLKTDLATLQDGGQIAARVQQNLGTGTILFTEATYTMTGNEHATDDVIDVCDVPVGCQVIPELCRVSNEASMGGSVLAIPTLGDVGDVDRYSATSITVHSSNAGVATPTPNVGASVIPRYSVTEVNKRIVAGFTRTNAPTAGKKLSFLIAFRLP